MTKAASRERMCKLRNKQRMDKNFDLDEHREKERKRIAEKKAETAKGAEWQPQRKLEGIKNEREYADKRKPIGTVPVT